MNKYNSKEIAYELLKGKGYFIVENLFSKKDVSKAKKKLIELARIKSPDISKKDSLAVISATNHVWNLIDKDEIFRKLVQNELIIKGDYSSIENYDILPKNLIAFNEQRLNMYHDTQKIKNLVKSKYYLVNKKKISLIILIIAGIFIFLILKIYKKDEKKY